MTDFTRISADQALELRSRGAVVVDVRDPQSYALGHISGSLHLDNQSLHDFITQADLDTPLIVSCYHGNSSQSAAAYLVHQGFSEVYSLDGGFDGWRASYPDEIARSDS